ncbi:autotransporter outer membrane beta-barrel domain-containing protein [Pseudomonas nitroreducens]|uniref:autotransporter outer membrane beta-barrel domain-containing protein n=1 Tax=Pseudomonas nitroreducens TaxID=46680 RepID=UPI001FB5ACA2|nr:autotransporter outer membrane beta-barrel domain-containing protein [Pseudomonas nitroreducens]MCJ1882313.1 autotransporter outer membrane beta-barrel domain-containing protein [Pseudomonas nitroreducens]MCJ1893394.1 autotransporter outer membrane beta-barrel domain-containing protein [Pseudomonas nitroreducens]
MNKLYRTVWNASTRLWNVASEFTSSHGSAICRSARTALVACIGALFALTGADFAESADVDLLEDETRTILGGYKDKAAGAADSATFVPDNFTFKGGTLDLTGGYYRATGRITVEEDGYGKITGGSSANLPSYYPTIPILNRAPNQSGAMFLLYDPRKAGSQLVLGRNSTLEIAFNYEGRNYVAVTNNGNYDYQYTPVVFGEGAHIKLTNGTFRFDPYRHDRDVKLSNFIFNGGWLSTRGGDDLITADEDGQAIGKIEMGMGSDTFVVPEGINITALRLNGVPVSEVRMYEFATASTGATDAGTGGLTGNMGEGTGTNPSDTVDIRAGASSTDIAYTFGYYNDVMNVGESARLIGGTVDMGNGPDTFNAPRAILDGANIKLGDGNDTLNLNTTTLKNNVAFDLGNGNDIANIEAMGLTLGEHATLKLGAGDDVLNLTDVTLTGDAQADSIDLGAGNDTVNLKRVEVNSARVAMNTGTSAVRVSEGTTRVDESLEFTRSGTAANQLIIENGGELLLDHANLKFAGKVIVDVGGTLKGEGVSASTDGLSLRGKLVVGNGLTDGELTIDDANGVTADNAAQITGSGLLRATRLKLQGVVEALVQAGRKLVYNDPISDAGVLRKTGEGDLELGAASDYTGGTLAEAGTLVLKHQDAAGTGSIDVAGAATVDLDFFGTQGAYDATFDNPLSGTGLVQVNGQDIDLSADNSAFSGRLEVQDAASAQVRASEHLGDAVVNLEGTLRVAPSQGGFAFANSLSGHGMLAAEMASGADAFDFTSTAGAAFQGTLGMGRGQFDLSGTNTQALTLATLRMDDESTTTIGSSVQQIHGLAFNGGTAKFGASVPDATRASASVAAQSLDASGTGVVQVDLPTPYVPSVPGTVDTATLLEQDDGLIGLQLVQAQQVTGSGGALELQDQTGQTISAQQQVEIAQGGEIVAIGDYDFGLTTAPGDGLYVNYGLRQVDLQQDQTLTLQQAPGATGAAADLAARVTGTGNLAVEAGAGKISLSNARNDYSGSTHVGSGGLQLAADNALGQTAELQLESGTSAELVGHAQRIGALQAQAGSSLDLQGGTLAIDHGGQADGVLSGAGELGIDGGTLNITGANSTLSAQTSIAAGATASLTQASGLGSGAIATQGTLELAGARGELRNAIRGTGSVELNTAADITASGDNRHFSGDFGIEAGSELTVSSAQNLGSAQVADDGVLRIDSNTDWSLDNSLGGNGSLIKDGSGLLNIGDHVAHSGATEIRQGGLLVDAGRTLGSAGADEVTVAAGALLAGLGTVSGHVQNDGTVSLLNGLAGHATSSPGTFTLANGLNNAGVVSLAGQSGSTPGNILLVKGDYQGEGGQMVIRTQMGDDTSATDKLVVDGGRAAGDTSLVVQSAGGQGAKTDQGIRVVETRNGATTAADAFRLDPGSDGYRKGADSLAAGAYDYHLARGGNAGVADDWYLVSQETPQPIPEEKEADTPTPSPAPSPSASPYRPEVGAYLSNRQAALAMPVHTLHERQGQAPGADGRSLEEVSDESTWVRVVGDHSSRDGAGGMDISARSKLLHLGSDLVRFSDGDDGSVRLGVMASWGESRSKADNGALKADSRVNGYNLGVYGTWYGNSDILTGPYMDAWIMHGSYNNRVKGDGLAAENYRSKTMTGSLEGGYSFKVHDDGKKQVYVEPQAQVVAQRYSAGSHTEENGTKVTDFSDNALTTRLGVRLHGNFKDENGKDVLRPFGELNWWHGPSSQTMSFNSDKVKDRLPGDRYEVKVGLQGQVSKNTSVWGSVAAETGSEDHKASEVQVGVKYDW